MQALLLALNWSASIFGFPHAVCWLPGLDRAPVRSEEAPMRCEYDIRPGNREISLEIRVTAPPPPDTPILSHFASIL